eukprot:CAMPEP_0197293004 /NCGR_PEP_ID=MMETSP0890-20130614/26317_1 /TAXON_ID=44058 ORGANISM="Aureoumbra lagunensis, Strain CCMP1510" /NCGR_SAMPLE_ID=MMETSP0890 /ASSEMBLY_ACC=CAM_ASM_000533 /LENGTH=400 /DNA_ID=CAMNT_0042767385 /DNA_START=114 /DNA_END=1316 /DNA_ORIENTATION=-
MEMSPDGGFSTASWSEGFGDFSVVPDLLTLRRVPWLSGTAMVLCDVIDSETGEEVPHAPRAMLKKQMKILKDEYGYELKAATELEFFLFNQSLDVLKKNQYTKIEPIGWYNEDYSIFGTVKEENIMRPIRNALFQSGIPIEGSKGEAEAGQQELNIKYSSAELACEHHIIAKHAVKDIAFLNNYSASFMAKYRADRVGSAAHIHLSLWQNNNSVFYDPNQNFGMSNIMQHFLAGLLALAPESTLFHAPSINSYKRFTAESFAPTKILWSVDNRTAAFRLVAPNTSAVRIECRIPGADANPYLSLAAIIASGIYGIKNKLPLSKPFQGDAYSSSTTATQYCANSIPSTLRDAIPIFKSSSVFREAFGPDVVDHYAQAAIFEQTSFDKAVTDWELNRYFERA